LLVVITTREEERDDGDGASDEAATELSNVFLHPNIEPRAATTA
jgi:hypothetical protein